MFLHQVMGRVVDPGGAPSWYRRASQVWVPTSSKAGHSVPTGRPCSCNKAGLVRGSTFPEGHIPHTRHLTLGLLPRLTKKGSLGHRALVHKHLLILPMSGGHKLVPLSRRSALLGEVTKSKAESGRTEMVLPLGSPPRYTEDSPSLLSTARPALPTSATFRPYLDCR